MSAPLNVLYEDNHLIAVHKPAGILVQGDHTGDISLMDMVKTYLKETYKKPGNVFLGLIHRLDRPVSGVVLFAKTSKGASRLSEQFRERTVEKIYHAWVHGVPAKRKATLRDFISKDEMAGKATIFDREEKDSVPAELSYEVVNEANGKSASAADRLSCLKIRLGTGRFHQIRAQLSNIGHPIVGDVKYGAPKLPAGSHAFSQGEIALTATSLAFELATHTPDGEERKTVSIPVPQAPKL